MNEKDLERKFSNLEAKLAQNRGYTTTLKNKTILINSILIEHMYKLEKFMIEIDKDLKKACEYDWNGQEIKITLKNNLKVLLEKFDNITKKKKCNHESDFIICKKCGHPDLIAMFDEMDKISERSKIKDDRCKEITGFTMKEMELLKEIYLKDNDSNSEKEMVKKGMGDDSLVDKPEPIRLSSNERVLDLKEGIPSIHSKLFESNIENKNNKSEKIKNDKKNY